jgi:hypothetical protein
MHEKFRYHVIVDINKSRKNRLWLEAGTDLPLAPAVLNILFSIMMATLQVPRPMGLRSASEAIILKTGLLL